MLKYRVPNNHSNKITNKCGNKCSNIQFSPLDTIIRMRVCSPSFLCDDLLPLFLLVFQCLPFRWQGAGAPQWVVHLCLFGLQALALSSPKVHFGFVPYDFGLWAWFNVLVLYRV